MTDAFPDVQQPDAEVSATWLSPWCTEEDIPPKRIAGINDVSLQAMIGAASNLLYELSGRQFRQGRSVVRPTSIQSGYGNQSYLYPYSSMSGYGAAWGFAAGWSWTAVGMGWWQNGQDLAEVVLSAPVQRINNVMVNGSSLGGWFPGGPPNPNFTLYDKRRLVRNVDTTGMTSGAWPWNQQLQLPLTEAGTWMIDYNWGKPPPPIGNLAAVELTIQLALALTGKETALPARVLSIATQGVSVAVGDSLEYLRERLLGLPVCDAFIMAVNPQRARRKATFLAPNSLQGRQQESFP